MTLGDSEVDERLQQSETNEPNGINEQMNKCCKYWLVVVGSRKLVVCLGPVIAPNYLFHHPLVIRFNRLTLTTHQ